MTAPITHEIELTTNDLGRHVAVCSCGRYKSSSYTYSGAARDMGAQHIRSKKQPTRRVA
jgi:hypothetical protein